MKWWARMPTNNNEGKSPILTAYYASQIVKKIRNNTLKHLSVGPL